VLANTSTENACIEIFISVAFRVAAIRGWFSGQFSPRGTDRASRVWVGRDVSVQRGLARLPPR
jgi:hypothetical protein